MKYILGLSILLLSPYVAHGSIEITEIMYDLEGGDTDREWIEVYNSGSESIDLSLWKLREADTNHSLTLGQGAGMLPTGGYAVIVDSLEKFLIDYPGFSGIVFDSSFSLSNTGESLSMRDVSLNDFSVTSYDSSLGAAGDGNSLQKIGGVLKVGKPTPGASNSVATVLSPSQSPNSQGSSGGESSQESSGASASSREIDVIEQKLYPKISGSKVVVVGSEVQFNGSSLGIKKEPLSGGRYVWTFGDGTTKEGKNVLHTYQHPGEYVLVLTVSSGEFMGTDRAIINAISSNIKIISSTPGDKGFIALQNETDHDIDLSRWIIRLEGSSFTIPNGTIILAKKELKFPNAVTGFRDFPTPPTLHYQNGSIADSPSPEILLAGGRLSIKDEVSEKKEIPEKTSPVQKISLNKVSLESKKDEEKTILEDRQDVVASVAESIPQKSDSKIKWFLFLGVLLLGSAGAYLFVRSGPKSEADEYEIVE